ncbi:hypothetical protein HAX54_038596 [Datura stramonium]|uniref:Uncharacterized protein n=1 Tax=Datura stramonium TaxID=4076 RepID=A0ABS8SIK5_DATST|nr:hypothetical protein [Datura stramonium]
MKMIIKVRHEESKEKARGKMEMAWAKEMLAVAWRQAYAAGLSRQWIGRSIGAKMRHLAPSMSVCPVSSLDATTSVGRPLDVIGKADMCL